MNLPVVVPKWLRLVYPKRLWQVDTKEKILYLSFDDGPHATVTPQVLDVLLKYNAKASFFCLGKNVLKNQYVFARIMQEGHAVGNHGFEHLNGWNTSTMDYCSDVEQASQYIESTLFRPAYGRLTFRQARQLMARGYDIIMWTLLSADYDRKISKEECAKRIINNISPGSIILFHDSEKAAVNMLYALEAVLENAAKHGFRFEALPYKKGSA